MASGDQSDRDQRKEAGVGLCNGADDVPRRLRRQPSSRCRWFGCCQGLSREMAAPPRRRTSDRDAELACLVGDCPGCRCRGDQHSDRHAASICVVALERAALGVFAQSGAKAICGTARCRPSGRRSSRRLRRAAVHQHHVRMLGVDLVELAQISWWSLKSSRRSGDLRPRRAAAPRSRRRFRRRGSRGCRSSPR